MRRLLFLTLWAAGGCRSFQSPEPGQIRELLERVPAPGGPSLRLKVRLDLESPFLSGILQGVIAVQTGPEPRVRAQFFPDVGGKVLDLVARPDRITGCFPMTGEGLDIALPEEARIHPLSLMGITLLEHCAPVGENRVSGVREGSPGREYRLRGIVPGVTVILEPREGLLVRTFTWKYGITWQESCEPGRSVTVVAPQLRLSLVVLEKQPVGPWPDSLFQLSPSSPARPSGSPR